MSDLVGNIRRLDKEGRILIPRDVRRALKLDVGDALEVYVRNGEVIIKKYSALRALLSEAQAHLQALYKVYGIRGMLCDTDRVLAAAGSESIRTAIGRPLSTEAAQSLRLGKEYIMKSLSEAFPPVKNMRDFMIGALLPLHVDGTLCGGAILCVQTGRLPTEMQITALQYAVKVLDQQYRR